MRHFIKKYILLELLLTASVVLFSCTGEKSFPTPGLVDDIGNDNVPTLPSNPFPSDRSDNNFRLVTLAWQSVDLDGDSLLYNLYFQTDSVFAGLDQIIAEEYPDTFYTLPSALAPNTTFYWKIEVKDNKGNWRFGDVWRFSTGQYRTNPPVVTINTPSDNSSFIIHESISFLGSATDVENGSLTGTALQWKSNRDNNIGTGSQFSTSTLTPGVHTITLTATDDNSDTGSDAIQITVTDTTAANNPPTAEITQPADGSVFGQGAIITFRGTGVDSDDGDLTGVSLEWISSINGLLGTGSPFTYSELSVGAHTITLRATDSGGESHDATISLTISEVSPDNQEPTAAITQPSNNEIFIQGNSISFAGTGTDPEDGSIPFNSLSWESDRDGALGTGSPFVTSSLALGIHKIVFRVTDNGGKQDTAIVTIFVTREGNTAPRARLEIDQTIPPSTPSVIEVDFDASVVYDAQDPESDIEIRWDYENDGVWDTEYSTDKTSSHTYDPDDSPHYVRMIARDPGGLTDEVILIIPEMVYVPGGNFTMGSPAGNPDNEQPQRTVSVQGFYIDKYEVTNAQFALFLSGSGNSGHYSSSMNIEVLANGTFIAKEGKENYPVTYVDWYTAEAYSEWSGKRLPAEAEWEKAARGGAYLDEDETITNSLPARVYPWGTTLSVSYANYNISGRPYTGIAPVGIYTGATVNGVQTINNGSPYGVLDMLGNVGEWVNDWYQADYYSTAPGSDPTGPASGTYKVHRGGTFGHTADDIRISRRFSALPTGRPYNVGLRCAKTP
ncbi:SUMF1/EgtB/PvdO family nonheme iron enzyme [candidate division KSB1 bacterium]